jgi:hypothetical protein
MNVEIGAEAALSPEGEYINVIVVAVQGAANIATRVHVADMLENL